MKRRKHITSIYDTYWVAALLDTSVLILFGFFLFQKKLTYLDAQRFLHHVIWFEVSTVLSKVAIRSTRSLFHLEASVFFCLFVCFCFFLKQTKNSFNSFLWNVLTSFTNPGQVSWCQKILFALQGEKIIPQSYKL